MVPVIFSAAVILEVAAPSVADSVPVIVSKADIEDVAAPSVADIVPVTPPPPLPVRANNKLKDYSLLIPNNRSHKFDQR